MAWLEDIIMRKTDSAYIEMRCKIEDVFEHYAQQSEYYKRRRHESSRHQEETAGAKTSASARSWPDRNLGRAL
jgi:hypothetical protein